MDGKVDQYYNFQGLTVKDASAPEVLGKGLIFLRDQIIKEHGVKNLNITASDIQDIRSRSARKKLRDLVRLFISYTHLQIVILNFEMITLHTKQTALPLLLSVSI